MDVRNNQVITEQDLYLEAEARTNRDNIKYLILLAMISLLCTLLNEVGVFKVAPFVMRVGTVCGALCCLTPAIVLFRPLHVFERRPQRLEYRSWHKYFILSFAWLATAAACVTLTHHTVILMAVPIMLMAQYRSINKMIPITIVLGTACVLLGVYGGYFWGCFDGNLLQLVKTDENVADLALRASIATPKRMAELFTHYALPRELMVFALTLLAAKFSRRSNEMLDMQAKLQSDVEQEMQRMNEIQSQVIIGMANLIENRDANTGEHVKRTSFYVKSVVDKLRAEPAYADALSDKAAEAIVEAAPLHDIGKIVVADRILLKPGKLTPEEYEEIKRHADEGARVIENVLGTVEDEVFLCHAKDIAGCHHERWDGTGYPNGMSGEEIPLSARIMAVADVFDALVSKRVYKQPMPPAEAFQLIEEQSGRQFDPAVAETFCSLQPEIMLFLKENSDTSLCHVHQ